MISSPTLTDWFSHQWFSLIHGNKLVYNACWEDPRIDRELLHLGPESEVMGITSAGCNVLDYLLAGAGGVHAVDINPRQNALLELKLAAIGELEYDDFFALFGRGRHSGIASLYRTRLRPRLSAGAAAHWDRHLHYFAQDGLYFRGAAGAFARLLNHYVDFTGIREHVLACFAAPTLAEQSYLYRAVLRDRFWNGFLRAVLQCDAPFALLGVPRVQLREIDASYPGGICRFLEESLETVFARLPLDDNYFYWLYVTGSYTAERCPEYLKRTNFDRLRERIDRIRLHDGSILEFLLRHDRPLTHFVLLDHMDWLRGKEPLLLAREWELILRRAAPGARILWRSASPNGEFVNDVPVQGARLGEKLVYHRELTTRLQRRDRVHTYASTCLATLAPEGAG